MGRYAGGINLASYRSPFFEPYLNGSTHCCGWDAYRTILGKNPPKNFGNLSTDRQMVGALRTSGIEVIPLTVCTVTNRLELFNLVLESHVLLISQMFRKNEGSWCVLHGGRIFHNCEDETNSFHMLEFINRPILTAYILWTKKWERKMRQKNKRQKSSFKKYGYIEKFIENPYFNIF